MGPDLEVAIAAAVPIVPARYRRTAPTNPLDITLEVAMAKSALLYADRVTLYSWRVSLVQAWAAIRASRQGGDASRVIRLLGAVEFAFAKETSPALATLTEIPPEALTLSAVETAVGDRLQQVDLLLDAALDQPSWRDLGKAVDLGLVTLSDMGNGTEYGFSREAAIAEYLALIRDLTAGTNRAIPMLDYSAAGVLEVGTEVGLLPTPLPRSSTEMGLAQHYMGYLPAFPDASMDAILHARRELSGPLTGFRSAMTEIAANIAASPIEGEFARLADEAFRRDLAPHLKEISDISRERDLLPALRQEIAAAHGGTIVKTAIGLAAAGAAQWPQVAQAALAAAVIAGDVAGAVYARRRELQREMATNKLVWLYELDSLLSASTKRSK